MKRKAFLLIPLILALITEVFPTGAGFEIIYCKSTPLELGGREIYRRSFFDPFPIAWNSNFFPFLAGLLTVAALILTVIYLIKNKKLLLIAAAVCSFSAALCSLVFPFFEIKLLFYGNFNPQEFGWYGIYVAACLIFQGIRSILLAKNLIKFNILT